MFERIVNPASTRGVGAQTAGQDMHELVTAIKSMSDNGRSQHDQSPGQDREFHHLTDEVYRANTGQFKDDHW